MKKLALSLLALTLFASCSKDDNQESALLKVTVNNRSFVAQPAASYLAEDSTMTIIGKTGNRKIVLQTPSMKKGIYDFSQEGLKAQISFVSYADSLYLASSEIGKGYIEITQSTSTHVSGTFSFEAQNIFAETMTGVDGHFYALPVKKGGPLSTLQNGSFRAVIDNFPFTATALATKLTENERVVVGQNERISFVFTLPKTLEKGTYTLEDKGAYAVDFSVHGIIESGAGEFVVEQVDTEKKTIKASFSFTTVKTQKVITGSFLLKL